MDDRHGAQGLRVLVRVRRWVPLRARTGTLRPHSWLSLGQAAYEASGTSLVSRVTVRAPKRWSLAQCPMRFVAPIRSRLVLVFKRVPHRGRTDLAEIDCPGCDASTKKSTHRKLHALKGKDFGELVEVCVSVKHRDAAVLRSGCSD